MKSYLTTTGILILSQAITLSCAAKNLAEVSDNAAVPAYITLKMSPDGVHADLVNQADVRDKRIADLERRVAKLEAQIIRNEDATLR